MRADAEGQLRARSSHCWLRFVLGNEGKYRLESTLMPSLSLSLRYVLVEGRSVREYVAKDIEVRPGRVTHRNVKRNHNVIIYRHARHYGPLLRGRGDGLVEEEKTCSVSRSNESDVDKIVLILAIIRSSYRVSREFSKLSR